MARKSQGLKSSGKSKKFLDWNEGKVKAFLAGKASESDKLELVELAKYSANYFLRNAGRTRGIPDGWSYFDLVSEAYLIGVESMKKLKDYKNVGSFINFGMVNGLSNKIYYWSKQSGTSIDSFAADDEHSNCVVSETTDFWAEMSTLYAPKAENTNVKSVKNPVADASARIVLF